jgi:polysaccharide biosynthesis protein PslH
LLLTNPSAPDLTPTPAAGAARALPPLLYLVHRLPYPPDKGDRIRHAAVHLACLADEPVDPEAVRALRRWCSRVAVVRLGRWSRWARALGSLAVCRTVSEGAFSSPALRRAVGAWARETPFRACLASASSMVPYLELPELRGVPAVVDLVDVDSQKWLDYAGGGRGVRAWLYRTEGRRLRRLERGLPARFRAVTLVSDAEADLYRGFCDDGPVHVVRNGVDLDYFRPAGPGDAATCVFVGALDYRPNVEGVCWFCDAAWPMIRQRRPEARLYLVGRRPAPAVSRLAGRPGVEVVGPVADVRPHLARARVAVAPLRLARGVQNKVLEALAMARATVASPQALAGLRALPGTHLLSAAAADEWAAAVLRLLDDEGLCRQLGAAGRRYAEEHHCWERCLEPFPSLLGL